VGDVIQLDSSPHEELSVTIGGIERFKAKPGKRREYSAVQLTRFAMD
jgi:flagellar motor switch protein FliM